MTKKVFLLFPVFVVLPLMFNNSNETKPVFADSSSATLLFSPGNPGTDYFYNYCPSVMQEADGTRHIYYCTNKVHSNVTDYIGYRKGTRQPNGTYTWSNQEIVLSPTSGAWDSRHACDPSIIKGVFKYNNTNYSYLLAYLGCSSSDSSHNEVGIAVSQNPNGPFTKIPGQFRPFNPVSTTGEWEWGSGQPSIVSIDKAGKILFTYTIGDKNATRIVSENWDLSNLNSPKMEGSQIRISTQGLTQNNGAIDYVLNNADFSYDPVTQRMYMIRDGHPNSNVNPAVSEVAQLCYAELNPSNTAIGGNITSSTSWKVLKNITPSDTGLARNHNTCLVRDEYGHIPDSENITVILSSGQSYGTTKTWPELSSYRLYSYDISLNFPKNDYNLDVGVNISYTPSENKNVVWWRQQLPTDSLDLSSGNAVAIRIKNNTGIRTPIRLAFNSTNDHRVRALSNNDNSKLTYFMDLNGVVTIDPYRTWDGDVWVPANFDGWMILKKDDQVSDTTYANSGVFTWSSVYALYYGIENYKDYDAYANYDIGDIYTANIINSNISLVKPIFQCGYITDANTTINFALDNLGSGNINIYRKNIEYIPAVAFLNKLMTIDTCSASFSTGYKAYKNILNNYYNPISNNPIMINYYKNATLLDYQDGDTNHQYGLVRKINAQEKWEIIQWRYTNGITNPTNSILLTEENKIFIYFILLGAITISSLALITYKIKNKKCHRKS